MKIFKVVKTPKINNEKYPITPMFAGCINNSNFYIDENGYVIHIGDINNRTWQMRLLESLGHGYTVRETIKEIKNLNINPNSDGTIYNFLSKIKKAIPDLQFQPITINIICDNCGKKIKRTQSEIHNHNFCDRKCFGEWMCGRHDKDHPLYGRHGKDHPLYGRITSEKTKQKISATKQGISYDEWEFFVRDDPYCPLFNEKCRESNREKYGRRCFLTGLPESENVTLTGKWQRLSVHHVDMDKMQGCDGKRWKLVPICVQWHGKVHTELWIYRIIWLLNNVWDNKN